MHSRVVKWLATIACTALAAFALLYALGYLHMRAMKRARIIGDKFNLREVYRDFVQSGVVTNSRGDTHVYIFTNMVTISGCNYSCILAVDHPWYHGQGVLAITTNQVFIWLDKALGAKIIDDSYRPPLFPERY
jgi:hypothetical protein